MTRILLSLAFILAFTPAMAQEWPTQQSEPPEELPKILKDVQEDGAQIRYLGQYNVFHGWMIFSNGRPTFTYTTDDGEAYFQGMLFNTDGENVTMMQLQNMKLKNQGDSLDALTDLSESLKKQARDSKLAEAADKLSQTMQAKAKADSTMAGGADNSAETATEDTAEGGVIPESEIANAMAKAAEGNEDSIRQDSPPIIKQAKMAPQSAAPSQAELLYDDLEKANWVTIGTPTAPVVYGLIDPNCPHCRQTLQAMKPMLEGGTVQLRLLPIGFTDQARRVGALLFASDQPGSVLYGYINGQLPTLGNDQSINTQGVDRNLAVAESWGFNATPILFYRANTGEIKIIQGVPKSFQAIVNDLSF